MTTSVRLSLLTVVASIFAIAVPGSATAGEWQLDAHAYPVQFTSKGGVSEFRAGNNEPLIKCESFFAAGKFTTSTTGEFGVVFQQCKSPPVFNAECHTTGAGSGEISMAQGVFHNVYLTHSKTTPGILRTPPTGKVFATITCASFFTAVIAGNGVMADWQLPKCGETSSGASVNFQATGNTQWDRQVTATGTVYSLTHQTSGGSAVSAALVTSGGLTFAENITVTCV